MTPVNQHNWSTSNGRPLEMTNSQQTKVANSIKQEPVPQPFPWNPNYEKRLELNANEERKIKGF